jgi:hypothetical protein
VRLIDILVPGLPMLWEAFLAIYRPALGGLERYFALNLAVGAYGLMHLSRAEVPPTPKFTKTHVNFSVRKKIFCKPTRRA